MFFHRSVFGVAVTPPNKDLSHCHLHCNVYLLPPLHCYDRGSKLEQRRIEMDNFAVIPRRDGEVSN